MSGVHGVADTAAVGSGVISSNFDDHVKDAISSGTSPSNIVPLQANSTSATANAAVDIKKLPIGGIVTNTVNTTGAAKGQVYVSPGSYQLMLNGSTGNVGTGAWINADGITYDKTRKEVVAGEVTWPYQYTTGTDGTTRTITGNTLPSTTTGTYPIDPTTVAYSIDPNPNQIESENYTITMPSNPQPADRASPLGLGPVGVMTNGGLLYAAVDGKGNDANAYEVQDSNVGHPSETDHYHTHQIPETLYSEIIGKPNQTKIVGYAADGYAIVAETGADGQLLSSAQLDEFHGNTSTYVDENGQAVTRFHYTVSVDWPYTIGAFKGTPSTFEGLHTEPTINTITPPQPPPPLGFQPVGLQWDVATSKLYARIGNEWIQGALVDQAGQYVNTGGYAQTQTGQWVAPVGEVQYQAGDGRTFGMTIHYNKGPQQQDTLFQATYEMKVLNPVTNTNRVNTTLWSNNFVTNDGTNNLSGRIYDSTGAEVNGDGLIHKSTPVSRTNMFGGITKSAPVGDLYFVSNDGRYFSVSKNNNIYTGTSNNLFVRNPLV